MLEEDALRFDAFLKENDEKVQEAIKKAEVEAKAKQDKVGPTLTICLCPVPHGGSTGAYHCIIACSHTNAWCCSIPEQQATGTFSTGKRQCSQQ